MNNKSSQRGFFTTIAILSAVLLFGAGFLVQSTLFSDKGVSNIGEIISAKISGSDCSFVEKCETKPVLSSKKECKDIDICFDNCSIAENKCKCESKCQKQNICRAVKKCQEKTTCRKVYECKPSIKVTRPVGKAKIEVGKTFNIIWQTKGTIKKVNIALYKGGVRQKDIATNVSNNYKYSWVVDGSIHSGSDYKIRISSVDDGNIFSESDEFNITPGLLSVMIISPAGGEKLEVGKKHQIKWQFFGNIKEVSIVLYKGGQKIKDIASNVSATQKLFSWTIDNSLQFGDDYKIRINTAVKNEDGNEVFSESNNFNLVSSFGITVLYPRGGEKLEVGRTYNLNWQTIGNIKEFGKIGVFLYKDDQKITDITMDLPATQRYFSWKVGDDVSFGENYKIKVATTSGKEISGESVKFSILPRPAIKVIIPNGSEEWKMGEKYDIRWEKNESASFYVSIDLYKGDKFLINIFSSTANDGMETWMIPKNMKVGSDYVIKITDTAKRVGDSSDSYFKIF